MEDTVNKLFICSCNNVEHQLVMTYFTDDKEVYCSVHLKPEPNIFKRTWKAVKYIFGHRSINTNKNWFVKLGISSSWVNNLSSGTRKPLRRKHYTQ